MKFLPFANLCVPLRLVFVLFDKVNRVGDDLAQQAVIKVAGHEAVGVRDGCGREVEPRKCQAGAG